MKTILCNQLHLYLIKVQTTLILRTVWNKFSHDSNKLMSETSSKYFYKKRINILYIFVNFKIKLQVKLNLSSLQFYLSETFWFNLVF